MQQRQTILDYTGVARATSDCDPHPAQDNEKWGANTQTENHTILFYEKDTY